MFDVLQKYGMKLNPNKGAFGVSFNMFLRFMVNWCEIKANQDKIRAVIEMEPPWTVKEVQRLIRRMVPLSRFISKVIDKCLPFFKILKKASNFDWTPECKKAFVCLEKYLIQPPLLSKPQLRKDFYLYLAISSAAVSTVLLRNEEGIQLLMYYVSHFMVPTETRYPNLEKLALALLVAWQKLQSYF